MILITGGERSGKSSYALELAFSLGEKRVFIATAVPSDGEMKKRIDRHKNERGEDFETMEEPIYLERALRKTSTYDVRLVECMTTWVGNLVHERLDVDERIKAFLKELNGNEVIVTNEVGMGVIPVNVLARRYIETLGNLNQTLAKMARDVYMMVCGIAVKIK